MISVCIPVKNRVEQLRKCVAALERTNRNIEIVVADFDSDDTDYKWFKHKLVRIDDEHFSVGRGKNVAAENASGDILFFLDADLLVERSVIDRIQEVCGIDEDNVDHVYAPIMRMQNEDGSLGDWAIHSFGQIAITRRRFKAFDPWPEWKSYGGEDNVFNAQHRHVTIREKVDGFVHQWHPHELREKYGATEAYVDLKKFDKEFEPMKTYAHDPRFVFNGRYNSFPDAVVVREIWCENVYEVADGDLTDTGIVVDLGANIGAFSVYAAKLGAKKVIAVEPQPDNIELLKKNIDENKQHVPDCEFIVDYHAIGFETNEAFINNAHGDSRIIHEREKSEGMTKVSMITLQQLFEMYELEYIDVLKIDVEGYEGNIIINAPEKILNLCRYITIEYDQHSSDLGAIVEKLSKTHQVKIVGANGGMIFGKRY